MNKEQIRNEGLKIGALLLCLLLQASKLPEAIPNNSVFFEGEKWAKFSVLFTVENKNHLIDKCEELGIPAKIGLAIVWVESRGHPLAWNANHDKKTGEKLSIDRGTMQLNSLYFPETVYRTIPGTNLARVYKPYQNIQDNIDLGLMHLADLYKELGSWPKAIMAYNCGSWAVKNNKVPVSTQEYLNQVIKFLADV